MVMHKSMITLAQQCTCLGVYIFYILGCPFRGHPFDNGTSVHEREAATLMQSGGCRLVVVQIRCGASTACDEVEAVVAATWNLIAVAAATGRKIVGNPYGL